MAPRLIAPPACAARGRRAALAAVSVPLSEPVLVTVPVTAPATLPAPFWLAMVIAVTLAATLPARAQSNHATVAVPFYRPADLVAGLHKTFTAPRSAEFAQRSERLTGAVQALCDAPAALRAAALQRARAQWVATVQAWEGLSTVAVGPLIERRSARQIDFNPPRPEMIARAIERAPQGAADMERIGAPAKGLPALEWLLWRQAPQPLSSPAACAYAVQAAAGVAQEAALLAQAFAAAAARQWDDDSAAAAFAEFINQWVGAVERLRWAQIERPLREATTRRHGAAAFPRHTSGISAASWTTQWQALRELGALRGNQAPAAGSAMVPVETYLRGRGLNPLADRWLQSLRRSDVAMQALRPTDPARLRAAAAALAGTRQLAESAVAPALEVSIGFSDADGD